MLIWNWAVAKCTLRQLAQPTVQAIYARCRDMVCANVKQTGCPTVPRQLLGKDYLWVAMALADQGIRPMLGPNPAKWFVVVDYHQAMRNAAPHLQSISSKVLADIYASHGIRIDMDAPVPEPNIPTIQIPCSFCRQNTDLPRGLDDIKVCCPHCGAVETIWTSPT